MLTMAVCLCIDEKEQRWCHSPSFFCFFFFFLSFYLRVFTTATKWSTSYSFVCCVSLFKSDLILYDVIYKWEVFFAAVLFLLFFFHFIFISWILCVFTRTHTRLFNTNVHVARLKICLCVKWYKKRTKNEYTCSSYRNITHFTRFVWKQLDKNDKWFSLNSTQRERVRTKHGAPQSQGKSLLDLC